MSTGPADFRYERTALIDAPPDVVFEQVNDFHNWDAWSPWAKIDPAMSHSVSGPAAGRGSVYKWSGNSEAGSGTMTITNSEPDSLVGVHLEFTRPYVSTSEVKLSMKPQGSGTLRTPADSSSEYSSSHIDHRMSYIQGEETDEEEETAHSRSEVEAWSAEQVAEYLAL